jgi:uncharacterized protein (DUF736 family)
MIIGVFTPRPDGTFHGRITTLTMDVDGLTFFPAASAVGFLGSGMFGVPAWPDIAPPDCKPPDYGFGTPDGGEFGVAWSAGCGNLVAYIDDPRFFAPLYCRLTRSIDGCYELHWDRHSKLTHPRPCRSAE